jgi:serine/threonine-protein kinase
LGVDDRPTVAESGGPVPSADAGELVDTVLDGKYRITRKLGAGSMGDVYEGRQEGTGRRVAIKVLKPERASREVHRHRFLREAKSALMIPHPNVVEVIEVGATEHGLLYFTMEYLQGEDLAALLKRRRHLPWSQTREILLQVSAGLAAAHARGIVHRDIKPSNILLLAGRDPPVVKIVDFGIAKLSAGMVSRVLTSADDVVGTVLYMSPEQAEGDSADERSDIYALGVMAYETVVGRVPFPGNDIFKVMAAHLRDPPTPPDELVPDLPAEAAAFIMTCLRKRPAERYPNMEVVLGVLEGRVPAALEGPRSERVHVPRLDAGLETPIGEDVTRLATHPTAPTVAASADANAVPRFTEPRDSAEFEDAPTAYFRLPRPDTPAAPGPKGTTPRVPPPAATPHVEAHPGASQRGMTVPMAVPPPGSPDPFSPFSSGPMPSLSPLSSPGFSRPDMPVHSSTTSGRTERLRHIPRAEDDAEERSATPKIIVILLVMLALGVAFALATVVT